MNHPTIIVTGGHVTPAIAVIEELQEKNPDWQIEFIGRTESFESGGSPSYEATLMREMGIPFHPIIAGKLQRPWTIYTLLTVVKIPVGIMQAMLLILKFRPQIVLTFGGYVAIPVVAAAWVLGVPIVTHEQTQGMGFANTFIMRLAWRTFHARDIGVPIRKTLFRPPARPSFAIKRNRPLLYITGGSTGAISLNTLVFPLICELIKSFTVVHQTGWSDRERAQKVREALPVDVRDHYITADYFHGWDVAWLYRHVSLLIGRSGANTVAEVAALGVPSLFIPLPWSSRGEQDQNAQKLVQAGSARVLAQQGLTDMILLSHITDMIKHREALKHRALEVARIYPRESAREVAREIERIVAHRA
ncbi:UDP-N-acetylglucosamine--N-acetylmuramyl-(pentapeptide) pyrophosphoryl-undecaprenol N-acetylglucosamine transferase [Candidatus Gottesmanbacteria bacterium]|nr:UDP-N-acetylglucosamine--N-acetylmuramyl-(pentapeptide) pyrophosphoryl-undecaprenol N-acetylglucosamine transferase [Candidatus Gottesmanbacteria bacterium]